MADVLAGSEHMNVVMKQRDETAERLKKCWDKMARHVSGEEVLDMDAATQVRKAYASSIRYFQYMYDEFSDSY